MDFVAFDWNGTLLADNAATLDASNHLLVTYGGQRVDIARYRETFTVPVTDYYVANGCDPALMTDSAAVSGTFHTRYEANAANCRTRPGSRQMLTWLKSQSIDAAILSNHTVEGIESQLRRLCMLPLFSAILANSAIDDSMKQGKLEMLRSYLQDRDYDPSNCAIVGDTTEEIEIGKELGIVTIAIANGYHSTARLRKANPDHLITNMGQVAEICK